MKSDSQGPKIRLFSGARKRIRYVILASTLLIGFCTLEFLYQFYYLIPNELGGALLRSFALSGATLVSLALTIGPLRTLFPRYNFVKHRRTVGVWGFTFIMSHFLSVMTFLFEFDFTALFWHNNPFANPILFAMAPFTIFSLMWITSTDWAVAKMGSKRWKALHRLVFFAYIGAILHFSLINPELLLNPAGYLLMGATVAALVFELAAFAKTIKLKGFGKGAVVGLTLIIWGGTMFVSAFGFREAIAGNVEPNSKLPMSIAATRMKDFMKQKGGNPAVAVEPVPQDKNFVASKLKSGMFERLNYMTSGSVTLEKKDGKFFVVFGDDFSTPNGPDLVVYLTLNLTPTTRQDVQNGIQLSTLKSTIGKQVYEIPGNVDITQHNSVTIHCRAFNVPWSFATLG